MGYKLLKIRPFQEFFSEKKLREISGLNDWGLPNLALFNLPLIMAVLGPRGQIDWNVTSYLAEESMWSRSTQGDTVRSYAESLIKWLTFLESRGMLIFEASEVDLQTYRNELCNPTNFPRSERYASQTINLRVKSVIRYYKWAEFYSVFSSPLGRWLSNETNHFHSLVRNSSFGIRHRSWTPKIEKRIPKVLTKDELQALFKHTPKPYSLMFRWSLVTGIRRFELCNLQLTDLPNLQPPGTEETTIEEIPILRKGGRVIPILAPIKLIQDTKWYVLCDRPKPAAEQEQYLFLNGLGQKIAKQNLSKVFRKIANHIGTNATLHHLRHTYAVYTLHILQRKAREGESINPLKTLQILMGHASIESTEIYLRALHTQNEAVEESLDFLYGATI